MSAEVDVREFDALFCQIPSQNYLPVVFQPSEDPYYAKLSNYNWLIDVNREAVLIKAWLGDSAEAILKFQAT